MRVLFVSPYVPSRIRVRPFQWIRALAAQGHEVHLVALRPPEDAWAPLDDLRAACASVDLVELTRVRTLLNGGLTLLGSAPLQFAYSHHPGAERLAADLARRHRVDVVHVEHLRGAVLASRVREAPRVFDAVDAIGPLFAAAADQAPSRAQRALARLDLARTRRFEARALDLFDRVLVTSAHESDAFAPPGDARRQRIVTLGNGVDAEYFAFRRTPDASPTVVFSGKMSYHANEAAALRLAQRIMPAVWAAVPGARLAIVGKDPSPRLQALASDRVTVTGYVDDLRPHLWRAHVAVAPLVYGAGIQNKVLEAMSAGVPVVASPEAVRALAATPGEHLLVAPDDAAFATAIVSVLSDADRAERLGRAGRTYVETRHGWDARTRDLVGIYEAVVEERRSGQSLSAAR